VTLSDSFSYYNEVSIELQKDNFCRDLSELLRTESQTVRSAGWKPEAVGNAGGEAPKGNQNGVRHSLYAAERNQCGLYRHY
jgi:uncharacterized protein YjcR